MASRVPTIVFCADFGELQVALWGNCNFQAHVLWQAKFVSRTMRPSDFTFLDRVHHTGKATPRDLNSLLNLARSEICRCPPKHGRCWPLSRLLLTTLWHHCLPDEAIHSFSSAAGCKPTSQVERLHYLHIFRVKAAAMGRATGRCLGALELEHFGSATGLHDVDNGQCVYIYNDYIQIAFREGVPCTVEL